MKNLFSVLILGAQIFLVGCYGLNEKNVTGVLEINKKSGWEVLTFVDVKTKNTFDLKSGRYTLNYVQGFYGFRETMIEVSNEKGQLLGHIGIPRESVNSDKSFEIYVAKRGNTDAYNILGGHRKVYQERTRFSKIKQFCTYSETYACVDDKMQAAVCTRSVSGLQDEVWEQSIFKNTYRILFDGADIVNVAVFRGDGQWRSENKLIEHTTCQ